LFFRERTPIRFEDIGKKKKAKTKDKRVLGGIGELIGRANPRGTGGKRGGKLKTVIDKGEEGVLGIYEIGNMKG